MQLLQLMGAALGRVTVPLKLPIGRDPPIRGTSCFYLHDHAYHVRGSASAGASLAPWALASFQARCHLFRGAGRGLRPGWQAGYTIHSFGAGVLRIFVAPHVWLDHPSAFPCPLLPCSSSLSLQPFLQLSDGSAASW